MEQEVDSDAEGASSELASLTQRGMVLLLGRLDTHCLLLKQAKAKGRGGNSKSRTGKSASVSGTATDQAQDSGSNRETGE
jgi:hypothetical protein